MRVEPLAVVREAHVAPRLEALEGVGERHFAEAMMVSVGLAVRCDVNEPAVARQRRKKSREEPVAVLEQVAERDAVGDRPVVGEDGDRRPRRQAHEVGHRRVERPGIDRVPRIAADWANAAKLVRGEDRVAHPFRGEHLERLDVDGRLRHPERLGAAAEPVLEVADAPPNLRFLVATRCEGKDGVAVRLRDGRAVPGEARLALAIRVENRLIGARICRLHPREERRPDVEAHPGVRVHHPANAARSVEQACPRVRSVALVCDLLVPVVEWARRILRLDASRHGFSRGGW